MNVRAVVLAAGASRRAGKQKLLADFRGRRMIDYALDAAAQWQPVVVASAAVFEALAGRPGITLIRNTEPERGMSHSLKLANAALAQDAWMMLLLADKPLVTAQLAAVLHDAVDGADVVFPVHPESGVRGHPVLFSPAARTKIAALEEGDTIYRVRDDPGLVRRAVPIRDEGAYFDVDAL